MEARSIKKVLPVFLIVTTHFGLYAQNVGSLMDIGYKLQQQNKYIEAIVLYQKILNIKADDINGMYQKALCQMRNNEPKEALLLFLSINNKRPDFVGGAYGAASAYLSLSDYSKALEYIEKALAFEPQNPEYYMLRGQIYVKMEKLKCACADFKKAKKLGNLDAQFSIYNYCR